MEREHWDALEAEVDVLLALDSGARAARLVAHEMRDPAFAAELRRWLGSIEASEDFLSSEHRARPVAGQALGAWRLLQAIGRGGMGEVWRGERADDAFVRQVAIKFLRADRPGAPQQLARERALLARLRHPHIAQLLDGGQTADGQPYLVTEWVDGATLDVWLDAAPRSLGERVALLQRVADAVAFAHANLVVHRDLKPGNVMVVADGTPRLLDFGIARLLDADLQSAQTNDRALTPGFAAPEQVTGEAFTTRTDVYGLGALLYWLLTGRAPHDAGDDSLARWVARVSQQDVVAPSQRADRTTTFVIDADLSAITLNALARDPAQRYVSADALAQDLARWLRGDAVSARLPTRIEHARRFLRRHRGAVSAAALVVLAIAIGVVSTRAQELAARREAARATAVKDFLVDLFDSIHPQRARGGKVLVEDIVARGELEIPQKFAGQPALQYELLDLLANVRLALEQPKPRMAILEQACPIAEDAHGDASVELAECLTELADAQRVDQQLDAADASVARALAVSLRLQPTNGVRVTEAMRVQFALARDRGDAATAERIIRDGIARGRGFEGGMGVQTAFMLEDLAVFLPSQQRGDEALPLLEEILAFDREQPQARAPDAQINTRWNRLTHFWGKAQFARTVEEADALAAFTAQALGRNHPHWFRCMQLRSLAQGRLGRYLDAVQSLDAVLAVEGIDAWNSGRYRQLLGSERVLLLPAVGRAAEAEASAREVLALTDRESLPPGSALVATFGATLAALSRHDPAAIGAWRAELDRRYAALTPAEQGAFKNAMLQLRGNALRVAGDPHAALPLLEEAALAYRLPDGGSSQRAERALAEQGFALIEAGNPLEAAARLRAARALLVTRFDDNHPGIAQIDVALATLPDSISTAEERARRESAAAKFRAATGREVDAFVLL